MSWRTTWIAKKRETVKKEIILTYIDKQKKNHNIRKVSVIFMLKKKKTQTTANRKGNSPRDLFFSARTARKQWSARKRNNRIRIRTGMKKKKE